MSLSLGEIAAALGGELLGDAALVVDRLAPLTSAGPEAISFLSHARYRKELAATRAACVIVAPAMRDEAAARGACLVVDDPYLYFARLTQLWKARHARAVPPGIHPTAVVDAEARIDPTATIGPLCVVERGAVIGAGTVLKSRVTVGEDCTIGARCLLHPGVVIGADGFGLAPHQGAWVKIEQLGAVRIGDDVEIGANTCIDRGALEDTVIEDGVKLDNLIQIGHNVRVGRNTAMAGCVGVAGSADIGAQCTIGGGAVVLGHLKLVDGVHVSAATVVTRSILKPGQYTGVFPFDDNAAWERNAATLRHLHQLRERLRALEKNAASGQTP
ncbi:UDP-3-O-(3-hydroxymyristoyl)glucosamine N-acyltransferase [Pseudacidovorax intermedius]|uniref:UDP-3-O-acylglucosamine N-acyltransferase n=1 Tax=Pseudacidovorax intermedius TaxID=433924 RepID=A0A147H0M3_9BURK|nr:UDP-3-O-(3-hydroxymyristoyl)glucosamine N-acyltransferase [Pseudacidovorax intermedius]KTT23202.1 UDP-3-O-(3-hydroxymyristoyl) glucosamine N-acyltransferase [Pseudacidovorax intermedius]